MVRLRSPLPDGNARLAARVGARVGAEHLDGLGRLADVGDGGGDRRVTLVTVDVDEEDVLPGAPARRSALDLGHVEAALGEGAQHAVEDPRLVARHQQERRLVATGRLGLVAPEHQEAGHVVGQVFNLAAQHRQLVELGRQLGADRGAARVVAGQAGGLGGRARFDQRGAGEIGAQPAPHLRQRDRDRIDALDLRHGHLRAGEQAHVHLQRDLGAHLEVALEEGVEGVGDHPFRGVLHGDHAVVGVAALDLLEHGRDGPHRDRPRREAELLFDRDVREGPLGAEVGDAHALLEGQTGAEDLLKHRADRLGGEGPRVGSRQPLGDLSLARRDVKRDRDGGLEVGHPADVLGAPVEQGQDLVVGGVDLRAQLGQLLFQQFGIDRGVLGHRAGAYYTRCVRLATLRDGTRDGALLVVGHDGRAFARAAEIAPTLQAALDDWRRAAPALALLAARLDSGAITGERFDEARLGPPLPRAYEWIDGSAFLNHVRLVRRARGATPPPTLEVDPLIYQGGSGVLLGPRDDLPLADADWGLDFESEVAVIVGDVPRGTTAAQAASHVRLVLLANDVTLRNLVPGELAKGFGFFQSKPATAFSPFAATLDELGGAWRDGRLHLPLRTMLRRAGGVAHLVGDPDAGLEMHFSFLD